MPGPRRGAGCKAAATLDGVLSRPRHIVVIEPEGKMIIRVVRFRVAPSAKYAAIRAARNEFFGPDRPRGLLHATFGRQDKGDDWPTFVTVTEWADMESLYAWLGGPDLKVVALPDGWTEPTELIDVQHYLAERPDELSPADGLDGRPAHGSDDHDMPEADDRSGAPRRGMSRRLGGAPA